VAPAPVIDKKMVIADLEAIVRGREDYVYRRDHATCVYREKDGSPSCIVGHVLARHSLLDEAVEGEIFGTGQPASRHFTYEAIGVLCAAQSVQDNGVDDYNSWGDALHVAKTWDH
jgi:hypothetical protein